MDRSKLTCLASDPSVCSLGGELCCVSVFLTYSIRFKAAFRDELVIIRLCAMPLRLTTCSSKTLCWVTSIYALHCTMRDSSLHASQPWLCWSSVRNSTAHVEPAFSFFASILFRASALQSQIQCGLAGFATKKK